MTRDNLGIALLLRQHVEVVETLSDEEVIDRLHRAWRSERGRGARGHWSFSNVRFIALAHHLRCMTEAETVVETVND